MHSIPLYFPRKLSASNDASNVTTVRLLRSSKWFASFWAQSGSIGLSAASPPRQRLRACCRGAVQWGLAMPLNHQITYGLQRTISELCEKLATWCGSGGETRDASWPSIDSASQLPATHFVDNEAHVPRVSHDRRVQKRPSAPFLLQWRFSVPRSTVFWGHTCKSSRRRNDSCTPLRHRRPSPPWNRLDGQILETPRLGAVQVMTDGPRSYATFPLFHPKFNSWLLVLFFFAAAATATTRYRHIFRAYIHANRHCIRFSHRRGIPRILEEPQQEHQGGGTTQGRVPPLRPSPLLLTRPPRVRPLVPLDDAKPL